MSITLTPEVLQRFVGREMEIQEGGQGPVFQGKVQGFNLQNGTLAVDFSEISQLGPDGSWIPLPDEERHPVLQVGHSFIAKGELGSIMITQIAGPSRFTATLFHS